MLPDLKVGDGPVWHAFRNAADSDLHMEDMSDRRIRALPELDPTYCRIQQLEVKVSELLAGAHLTCENLLRQADNDSDRARVTLLCADGTKLRIHEDILRVSCSEFDVMLDADMVEGRDGVVRMPSSASPQTVRAIRQWMYLGECLLSCPFNV